jgi:hypothetical protein
MLESLFSLVAAIKNPRFPARKLNAEQKDEIKRIKEWFGEERLDDEFQRKLEDAERWVRDAEHRHSNKEKKKWGAFETADAAALTWHYRRTYFLFSGNIHSKIGALLAVEHQVNRGSVVDSVVSIVLRTIDEFVPAMQIEMSQAQIDEQKRIGEAAEKLSENAN